MLSISRRLAVLVFFAFLALPIQTKPINFAGRDLPFDFTAPGSKSVSQPTLKRLGFTVPLEGEQLNKVYGLLVAASPGARITINGRTLDMSPVERVDGLLFRVTENYLRSGSNEFVILRQGADKSTGWDGTKLFSLASSTEEVHFDQAFSDTPMAGVLPPVHSSQEKYDVKWYDCTWVPSMSSAQLSAGSVVWMGATSLDSTLQSVALDFEDNAGQMFAASVDSGPATAAIPFTQDGANNKLIVNFPAPIAAGTEFRIRVFYQGTPATGGAFGSAYRRETHGPSSTPVIFTFSEPYKARNWWPCKDQPADKATTTTQRVIVPAGAGWEVVTNGKLISKSSNAGLETWTWSNSHPISTYLISVCISNYIYRNAVYTSRDGLTTMAISHAIYPENFSEEEFGAAGTLEVMNFFADRFGEYPFLSEKYFTASHNSGSGMEHQTCTSMPGGDVFDGMGRRNVHELAHHWFGDKITCTTFDHVWLNEGFSTYCEALWDEFKFGRFAYWSRVNAWQAATDQPTVGPSSDNFDQNAVYQKGGLILHMLRHVVGDATFAQIMRDWAQAPAHAYGTALSADFETVAELTSGRELTPFFDQWLNHPINTSDPSRPTYRFNATTGKSGISNVFTFQLNQTQTPTLYSMPVDVVVTDETGIGTVRVATNTLATESFSYNFGNVVPCEVELDPDNWILKSQALSINTCGLPRAEANKPYAYRLHASFNSGTVTWIGGAGLPSGLSLSSTGLITGTPTVPGTYSVSVTASSGVSTPLTRSTTLNLDVVSTPLPLEIIVESRAPTGSGPSGGGYSESNAALFSDNTTKSGAPKTIGIGSRQCTTVGASASFRPAIAVAGLYDVFITLDDRNASTRLNANASWTITNSGPSITGNTYLHHYTPGLPNKWLKIASNVPMPVQPAGGAAGITLVNVDGDGSGGGPQDRFVMDAVKCAVPVPSAAGVSDWNYE
jgi:aminopeptidase N